MARLLWLGKWYLIAVGAGLLGMALIAAWDWFRYRRLPHALWLARQEDSMDTADRAFVREVTRITQFSRRGRR